MGIDYYGVLSIKRNSTDAEIKKAYRNLSLQFNPKRLSNQNALTVFMLICEAYDVLSNQLRRAVFDQYGEEGLKRGIPGPNGTYIQPYVYHGDPFRTYKEFFGTASPYADLLDYLENPLPCYNVADRKGIKKKQETIYHPLQLTLHEVFHGGVKKMKIHRLTYVDDTQSKTEIKEKILTVPIKPGLHTGTQIKFPEEGDQNPIQIPADIIFITEELPHDWFVREGDNLVMTCNVSLLEALMGTTITVYTLDNRTIRIPITDIVTPNYEKFVYNEGMPILESHGQKGQLILRFQIEFPCYLPRSSKTMIEHAFTLAKIGGDFKDHEMINKMVLADKMKRVDPDEQCPPV